MATETDSGTQEPLRVWRETKSRGGKTVTLISGVPADQQKSLGKRLKSACATGGALKNAAIEIQGNHIDQVIQLLKDDGYSVKRTGG